jgi:uncharacterized metal-binding protein
LQESLEKYDDKDMGHMARVCASVESDFYCRLNRVAETIEFIKRMQYREVGIATCVGLMPEARLFSGLLQASGISHYTVGCKIGAMDKTTIGIPENQKLNGGDGHESMCNPVMQAMVLNDRKTDFNILIGLCVGHDSLFIQHSRAPVSVMIVKDRVLGHNPVAALYNVGGMYSSFKEIGK